MKRVVVVALCALAAFGAKDYKSAIESPDATKILQKDRLPPAKHYTMPKNCITTDPLSIAKGKYILQPQWQKG